MQDRDVLQNSDIEKQSCAFWSAKFYGQLNWQFEIMSNIFLFRTYQKDIFDTKIEAKPCPEIQQLEVYWERMHNGKKPPWRTQICPTKLIDMLPFIFLID